MRICYFGTYREDYNRNRFMIDGLRSTGADVVECHVPLWTGIDDRVRATSGGWIKPRFMLRVIKTYLALLRRYRSVGVYDVLMVGYPGQFDVYFARLLAGLRHRPLVWDILMSIYLVAIERDLDRRSRLTVGLIRQLERWALRLPDRLIMDTPQYIEWFQRFHGVRPERFDLVPIGTDDITFHPLDIEPDATQPFTLIYYGTFIRNHGVPVIVEAARMLKDEPDIRFVFIGDGPEKLKVVALATHYALENVIFIDWMKRDELPHYLAQADVCLGVFGTTQQSLITVHNKIYEALAMRKPLITGDSAAVRSNFINGEHLLLVSRTDPHELADAIKCLQRDPDYRARLAAQGYQRYCASFTTQRLGEVARAHLDRLVAAWH